MKLCITTSFIWLIVIMVAVVGLFSASFIMFGIFSAQDIRAGKEDKELTESLQKAFKKCKQECSGYVEFLKIRDKKRKILSIVSSVIYIAITVIAILIAAFAIYSRTQGGQFFIGDKAYITIATGSMSEQNPKNPYYSYLQENPELENDMGNIPQYSFVEIERGDGNYKLFDIVAFEYKGVTYLHRIIAISKDGLYTTMGDSNSGLLPFERKMPASMIIGVFTGRQSLVIGNIITFLKSEFGILTITALIAFLIMLSIAKNPISKANAARIKILAENLDGNKGVSDTDKKSDSPEKIDNLEKHEEV